MRSKKQTKRGQRSKECDIIGCTAKGRVLARLGNIDIAYCPKHRKKYGERIINALVNSLFNHKLNKFVSEVKGDIFMSDFLCDECGQKVKDYVLKKTKELEEIIEYAENNVVDLEVKELK